jgi:hypothetical protein
MIYFLLYLASVLDTIRVIFGAGILFTALGWFVVFTEKELPEGTLEPPREKVDIKKLRLYTLVSLAGFALTPSTENGFIIIGAGSLLEIFDSLTSEQIQKLLSSKGL